VEEGNHGDHGAALDDDVEKITLADLQKLLGDQQMAGGGNGMNSVIPSMIPRMTTTIQSGMRLVRREAGVQAERIALKAIFSSCRRRNWQRRPWNPPRVV